MDIQFSNPRQPPPLPRSNCVAAPSARKILLVALGGAIGLALILFFAAALLVFLSLGRTQWDLVSQDDPILSLEEVMVMLEPAKLAVAGEPAAPPEVRPQGIRFIPTTNSQAASTAPDLAAASFISNRNTRAASEGAPDPEGVKGLPTQNGLEIPIVEMDNRSFADGRESESERQATGLGPVAPNAPARPPQPEPKAQPEAPAEEAQPSQPKAQPVREAEPIADVDSTISTAPPPKAAADRPPTPAFREPSLDKMVPKQPDPKVADTPKPNPPKLSDNPHSGSPGASGGKERDALQVQMVKSKLKGTIASKGAAAVDAVETPLGRYMDKLHASVGKVFTPACRLHSDRTSFGTVEVEFDVNPRGQPENLRIVNGGGTNAATQDLVLSVILQAKLPPLPADVSDYLIGNRLHISYGFIFH